MKNFETPKNKTGGGNKKIEEVLFAPEGWRTNGNMVDEYSVHFKTVKRIADRYRESNPEYFKEFKIERGQAREHYSPELVEIIEDELKKLKNVLEVPKGWKSRGVIYKELGTSDRKVNEIVDKYREIHPGYMGHFRVKNGPIREYYSPELIQIITNELGKFDSAPAGWMVNIPLSFELKIDGATTKKIADEYRESNPEYFKEYKTERGRICEHYSPELVQIIKQGLEKTNNAPETPTGWKTNSNLSKELEVALATVKDIADKYRETNPEYFKGFKIEQGRIWEHYSPDLVRIIKEELTKVGEASEGWVGNSKLAEKLGCDKTTLSKIANKYRKDNPEYFKFFKHKGVPRDHYSPEFIEILRSEVEKMKERNFGGNILFAPEGWKTLSMLTEELDVQKTTISRIVEKYIRTNPGYSNRFKDEKSRYSKYYSPELITIIENDIKKLKEAPEAPKGWETCSALSEELDFDFQGIKKIITPYYVTSPEYFNYFRSRGVSAVFEYYSPELVSIIKRKIVEFKEIPKKPDGWELPTVFARKLLNISVYIVKNIAEKYRETNPEYFRNFKGENKKVYECYSPELVAIISEEIKKIKDVPLAPDGWENKNTLITKFKVHGRMIERLVGDYYQTHPEYFKEYRLKSGQTHEHYSPELVEIIKKEVKKIKDIVEAPKGWKTNKSTAIELEEGPKTIEEIAAKYRQTNPEYFQQFKIDTGHVWEHYSPELIELIKKDIQSSLVEKAPEGWKVRKALSNELSVDPKTLWKVAERYRKSNPEYFKDMRSDRGTVYEHYSPELVELIRQELDGAKRIKELEERDNLLKTNFENLIQEIANKDTNDEEAKKIGEILQLLPGNAHDIILRYHPEYKGMKVGYVKKIIAEYLGDFMMAKRDWHGEDVERFKDILDVKGVHDVILYNLKNACLTFVNQQRKINPNVDEYLLVNEYFQQPEMRKLETSRIEEIRNAIGELRAYYDQIFEIRKKKPANIVESLKKGRVFPDINQLLNIREMQEKKKMLIADEMGLGKSASAIMTKEYLGLKCALVIIPSNVEDTWQNYLSDKIDSETGKQLGYFKPGTTPKVLMIDEPKDIKRLATETFDYVLISQEKMSYANYGDALEKIDFDMMIIDEVHKLKNIESGVRSQAVIKLAEKIQGENKYLTLLSGTPIPNKVQDIAISLKLLYPEKYKQFTNKDIVNRIIYGDLIDLRTEILMRTQMKELATSIEMPPITEVDIPIDLSLVEREIYEILLEEDELTASEKIILFRQFLLNPELLSMEPGIVGSKIKKLEETLLEDLKTQEKIVVFVNGYIKGVIEGKSNIINEMNLPTDVIVEEIYGEIGKPERKVIQDKLKISGRKTIVFVSGQTADVGVDFSGADGVIFYNDPWSKYDKKQQQARVYREGLKGALTSKTLITNNSIEEGIRRYINAKEKAVEKLLRGIQNTDAEKKLLHNDSKLAKGDIETNAELSKEYLSDWEKLMVHFGEGFESGEKEFRRELPTKAVEYAQLYRKLGRLTYQGNNARATATIIENMMEEKNQHAKDVKILDIASGPEMLKEAAQKSLQDTIYSTDINTEHFMQSIKPNNTMASSYLNLPNLDKSIDYCNLSFAFHQTSPIKYYKKNYERLQVLAEMNRVLKPGGRAIISMLHNIKLGDGNKFNELVEKLGFKVVSDYTGEAVGSQNYRAGFFTLEKVADTPQYVSDAMKFDSADNAKYVRELGDSLGREFLEGLDMKKISKGDSRLRDQRRMVEAITLGGKTREIIFNEKDRELYERELQSIADGEALRAKYGGIAEIPLKEIEKIGFERKLETPGYFLLYKIIENGGAVIIRGDYKAKKKKSVPA